MLELLILHLFLFTHFNTKYFQQLMCYYLKTLTSKRFYFSTFSNRLIELRCPKEHHSKSFLPTAIELYNTSTATALDQHRHINTVKH